MRRWFKRKKVVEKEDLRTADYVLAQNADIAANAQHDTRSSSQHNQRTAQDSVVQQSKAPDPSDVDIVHQEKEMDESDEIFAGPDLHWLHRVIGTLVCFCLGTIISSSGFRRMATAASNQQAANILQTALGNLLVLISSCFWTGLRKQLRSMWQETSRRLSSAVYIGSIATTLVLAFLQPPAVSLYYFVLMMIQYVSGVVYAISYIPCAKRLMNQYVERKMTTRKSSTNGDQDAQQLQQSNAEGVLA